MATDYMKIVVAVRCYNEIKNIERFLRGYSFADQIIISDGGSTDGSLEILSMIKRQGKPKIHLLNYVHQETIDGHTWNGDAGHMNFVLDTAKELQPDWIIFDDMDCVPNAELRKTARDTLEFCMEMGHLQVNAFRLYMWGDECYFPKMNNYFDSSFKSLWAWQPSKLDIHADESIKHGTLVGLTTSWGLNIPLCLLHKSWHPKTIRAKIRRYNALGLPMQHPLRFAGTPEVLPSWAVE